MLKITHSALLIISTHIPLLSLRDISPKGDKLSFSYKLRIDKFFRLASPWGGGCFKQPVGVITHSEFRIQH